MEAVRNAAPQKDLVKTYNNQLSQLNELKNIMAEQAVASGDWHVQTVKNISASERFTQQITKQKLGFMEMRKELVNYRRSMASGGSNSVLKEAINEQVALRNAMSAQFSGNVFGKNASDLYLPKTLGADLDSARVKYGMINQMIGAVAHQTVNWGKNTQWAGRQITVGLTMPLGMAAVGAAALALQVDKELTRIAKVYDTTNQGGMAQERELAQLRETNLATASRLAQDYGQNMQDVLNITAQLAATGLKGNELQQATSEVARIATLGEIEHQQAIDMTISLQTAFKLSNEELTESFNQMNAVENATSLGIKDIAEAIPRAASSMAALGGTVSDLTVMMVALKESGIDPAVGANAIKSATARLINPTKSAVEFFQKSFSVDLPAMVESAEGNVLELMKNIGGAMRAAGADPTQMQAGIAELFGVYQFDRATALITNLGDAVNGVQNQTAKAMEVVQMSTEETAATAATELERYQESISGKFKRAVEGLKAAIVPFGMTVLKVITPVVEKIGDLFEAFNGMSSAAKTTILVVLGVGAIVGPILMLVGIMANLVGNVVKAGTSLANLSYKFKALTPAEAAAKIQAKSASSAFDSQARSASLLAIQIQKLTNAMELQAVMQGQMAMTSGGVAMANNNRRTVVKDAAGNLSYAKGSLDENGRGIGGQKLSTTGPNPRNRADATAFMAMQQSSESIAENSGKAARNYSRIGTVLGGLGSAALVFSMIKGDSGSTLDTWINIAMVAGTIGVMFPSIFGKAASMVGGIGTTIAGWFKGRTFIEGTKRLATAFKVGGINGPLGVSGQISQMAPKFATIAKSALRIFGPVGIIAGGAWAIKTVIDNLNEVENKHKAIAASAQQWSEILGYTYQQGVINQNEGKEDNFATRKDEVDKLKAANEELSTSLVEAAGKADNFATVYRMAMQEALKVITSGGSVDQARQAFQVALQTAGLGDAQIDELTIKYDKVKLDDPEGVRNQLISLINKSLQDLPSSLEDLQNGNLAVEFFTDGTGLSSEARAAGQSAGENFGRAFSTATTDQEKFKMFQNLDETVGRTFDGVFNTLRNEATPEMREELKKMGVESMDELYAVWAKMDPQGKSDFINKLPDDAKEALYSYREMLQNVGQGLVNTGVIAQHQLDEMFGKIAGLGDFGIEIGVKPASGNFINQIDGLLGEVNKFANSLGTADVKAKTLRDTLDDADFGEAEAAAASARQTMEGTMDDIYGEAERRLSDHQDNIIDGIRDRGEAEQRGFEKQEEAQDASFDRREKAQEKHWDRLIENQEASQERALESAEASWDRRIERIEDERDRVDSAYDSRIEKINESIEAERNADELRQKIFDREQARISRMSQSFASGVDFNVALNSGELDEAAKIANDIGSRDQQWALEDAQQTADDMAAKRETELNAEIKRIEKLRDARNRAFDEELERVKKQKDAAIEAIRDRQEAERKALQNQKEISQERLRLERKNAQDGLRARRDANREATESAIESAQKSHEADKRSLEQRLRELKAFVPRNETEMRQHIARVAAAYTKYGQGLKLKGDEWSQFISRSLQSNVRTAAWALNTDINWKELGSQISKRVESGVGVTAGDLEHFIRTGSFPGQTMESFSKAWSKIFKLSGAGTYRGPGKTGLFAHTGKLVRHAGGASWSSKDRTGVPRTASMYPSEIPAVLKQGEFVVNKNATNRNLDLLQGMNAGRDPLSGSREGIVRHKGGIAESAKLIPGALGSMKATAIESAVARQVNMFKFVGQNMMAQMAQSAAAAGAAGGGNIGAGTFGSAGNWPPPISGVLSRNTAAAVQYIKQRYPQITSIGTLGSRPNKSDHPMGKAADFMIPNWNSGSGIALGDAVAKFFVDNPNSFGTKYVIWRDKITSGNGWSPYTHPNGATSNPTLRHMDHVHTSFRHQGGEAGGMPIGFKLPNLNKGGMIKYDNTLANLHKNESVLTAPLTDNLRGNLSGGGGDTYHTVLDLRGAYINEDVDIERAMDNWYNKKEAKREGAEQ